MARAADTLGSLWQRLKRKAEATAGELLIDPYRDQVAAARAALVKGDPQGAVEELEALLTDRPDHLGALDLLGAAKLVLGQPAEAQEIFIRAMGVRRDDPEALVGLGEALVEQGLCSEALVPLARSIEVAGGDRALLADAYLALGRAWRGAGDLDKAIRELRKAVAEAPDDAVARAALGDALLADDRTSSREARGHLERAAEAESAPALALLDLGELALADGLTAQAATYFERARDAAAAGHGPTARGHQIAALLGQGDVARARREHAAAHLRYLEALELDPKRGAIHARLAALHRDLGNLHAALAAYELALALSPTAPLLRAAIAAAHAAGDRVRAVRWANDLLPLDPAAPIALAARVAELIDRGELDAAAAMLAGAPDGVELALERARLERARVAGPAGAAKAAVAARAALELDPHEPRARAALTEARAVEAALPAGDDIGQLADALGAALRTRGELAGLVGDVSRATAELEQPLLVTVMGEFSSGKSSFVNAFIGADVAATGITPTTATINIVKYGVERGGRILGRDGSIAELAWDELQPRLRGLTADEARAIDRVEIVLPLANLAKVHIVDTPGLNSILPEHEDTARAFIARADAVVWVFTAGQGGKASERKALDAIRAQGKRVLGVLNKRDQLSTDDVAEVVAHVERELGDRVEVVIPFSARHALAARTASEPRPTAASRAERGLARPNADDGNWGALNDALERRFFAQARAIKRAACARRLLVVLDSAQAVLAADRGRIAAARDGARAARDRVIDAAGRVADDLVDPERRALAEAIVELYRRAAREVIELVRPRQLPFGSHSATPADRDYLLALLADGYEAMLLAGERRVAGAVHAIVTGAGLPAEPSVSAVIAPLAHARAYVAGFLAGGAVDGFFRNDLPRLSLDGDSVYHALFRIAPDLEALVAEPLARAARAALARAEDELERQAGAADVAEFDLDVGLGRSLDELRTKIGGGGDNNGAAREEGRPDPRA
jgi:tetratricopeptide (TPR) repeat protein